VVRHWFDFMCPFFRELADMLVSVTPPPNH